MIGVEVSARRLADNDCDSWRRTWLTWLIPWWGACVAQPFFHTPTSATCSILYALSSTGGLLTAESVANSIRFIKKRWGSCVIVTVNAIWRYLRFMKIRQRIFNCTDMQIMHFILDKIPKKLSIVSRCKVVRSQTQSAFLAHLVLHFKLKIRQKIV